MTDCLLFASKTEIDNTKVYVYAAVVIVIWSSNTCINDKNQESSFYIVQITLLNNYEVGDSDSLDNLIIT